MGWFDDLFPNTSGSTGLAESNILNVIFPLAINKDSFIQIDIEATYRKILTDTLERTHGIKKKDVTILWDNCVQSNSKSGKGLVSLLAEAMYKKSDLFLIYKSGVLREADNKEQEQIKKDYEAKTDSKTGVYISFKNYDRTDMLKLYAAFEYCTISSLNKTLNMGSSIQVKLHELRSSVSLGDSDVAKAQAKSIAQGITEGKAVYMDALDQIVIPEVDSEPAQNSIDFLNAKRAFYLDLPLSYISGTQTPGIGSTGEGDMRAVERGLKIYFFSIVKPVIKALLSVDTKFKTQDFRQASSASEVLRTFDLTSEKIMSLETKRDIIQRMFDIDSEEEEKFLEDDAQNQDDTNDQTNVDAQGQPMATPFKQVAKN